MDPVLGMGLLGAGEGLVSGIFGGREAGKRRGEREDVREAIFRLMRELRGRETPGMLDPGQQEAFVQQKMRATAPSFSKFANILAQRMGLSQPAAMRALAGRRGAEEMGLRFGLGREQLGRQFESEQRLRQLLASLTGALPS